jgi:non-ribosomal peptide synthetase component F
MPAPRLGALTLAQVEPRYKAVKFDLVVILQENEGGLSVTWNYSTDLFDEATLVRLHQQYERVLSQVVDTPQVSVSRIEVQTELERQQRNSLKSERRLSDFERLKSIKPKPITRPRDTE